MYIDIFIWKAASEALLFFIILGKQCVFGESNILFWCFAFSGAKLVLNIIPLAW